MADLQQEIADLRDATREAHEAIKDLRQIMREAREIRADVVLLATTSAEEVVDPVIVAALERYQATIATAIESATTAVYARFDIIADLLLGETKKQRRRYGESLPETAAKIAEIRGAQDA